jgi:hypothetical protein
MKRILGKKSFGKLESRTVNAKLKVRHNSATQTSCRVLSEAAFDKMKNCLLAKLPTDILDETRQI